MMAAILNFKNWHSVDFAELCNVGIRMVFWTSPKKICFLLLKLWKYFDFELNIGHVGGHFGFMLINSAPSEMYIASLD